MRFRLRTLLILLAIMPPIVAWLAPPIGRWLFPPPAPVPTPLEATLVFTIGPMQSEPDQSSGVVQALLPLPQRPKQP
jgi:hypothetical protein